MGQQELFNHLTIQIKDYDWKELFVLNSNTWNDLTVRKQLINIKKKY